MSQAEGPDETGNVSCFDVPIVRRTWATRNPLIVL